MLYVHTLRTYTGTFVDMWWRFVWVGDWVGDWHAACVTHARRCIMNTHDKLAAIEIDLREWGQAQSDVLSADAVLELALLCDRIMAVRNAIRRANW